MVKGNDLGNGSWLNKKNCLGEKNKVQVHFTSEKPEEGKYGKTLTMGIESNALPTGEGFVNLSGRDLTENGDLDSEEMVGKTMFMHSETFKEAWMKEEVLVWVIKGIEEKVEA